MRYPRVFKEGVVYFSEGGAFGGGEAVFLVIKPTKRVMLDWLYPVQYEALNLYTGQQFEFHRDSILAENARPWDSST